MINKYKSIICSLLLCSTLSSSFAGSEDYIDAYTPGTSSKVGLLKAGLMGMGLMGMGLMGMVAPVEAQFATYSVNNIRMKECYVGKMDVKNVKPYNNITITQIMDIPFSFSENVYQLRDISLQLNSTFTDYSFSEHTLEFDINTAYLCSMVFTRSPNTLSAKIKFDYENNNCAECFSMVTFFEQGSISDPSYYDLYWRTDYRYPTVTRKFSDVLKYVIDNGDCPPEITAWPTHGFPTTYIPTSIPTSAIPTQRPTKTPTLKPTTTRPTLRPTNRPTTDEPTTTNPTTSTPTTLIPTPRPSQVFPTTRPHHSFPTHPWPPFFPTPWAPVGNS